MEHLDISPHSVIFRFSFTSFAEYYIFYHSWRPFEVARRYTQLYVLLNSEHNNKNKIKRLKTESYFITGLEPV